MQNCPRCKAPNAVVSDRDIFGNFERCVMCGWGGETQPGTQKATDAEGRRNTDRWIGGQTRHAAYDINPGLYESGAPKPRRNDFVTRKEYNRVKGRWFYYNQYKAETEAKS